MDTGKETVTPIPACTTHGHSERREINERHPKLIHRIYTKMNTAISVTHGVLDHFNLHANMIFAMREISKYKLTGTEKKTLVISILTLLLDSLGVPHVVSYYTALMLDDMIEHAHLLGLHKYKKVKKKWRRVD